MIGSWSTLIIMIFCYWHQNIHQIFINTREQKLKNTEKNVNQSLKGRFTANELKCKYFWKGNKQLQIFWKGNRHNVPSLLKACLIFATKLFLSTSKLISLGEGGTQYKRPYRDVPPTWVAKSASWYMIPYKVAKFGIWMGWFFQKLSRLVYELVTFSWKIGFCMGLISNSVAAHPYQNQTWVPPGD